MKTCHDRRSRRLGRALAPALFFLLAGGSFGCAYYNTFFFARKYFREAVEEERKNTTGKLSPAAASGYEKAIKQCSKVLQRYGNSKWADDALFLMGRSYFGRQEYGQSRRWLEELIARHPESPYVPGARFWIARGHLAEEDFDQAGEIFARIVAENPRYEDLDQVQYYLAEVDFLQERYEPAVEKYQVLLDRYPKSDYLTRALLKIGDAHFALKHFPEAQRSYERAMARSHEARESFEAHLKVGQALEKQDRYAEALDVYKAMAFDIVPADRLDRILSGAEATGTPANPAGTANIQERDQDGLDPNAYNPANPNYNDPNYNNPNNPNYNPNNPTYNPNNPTYDPNNPTYNPNNPAYNPNNPSYNPNNPAAPGYSQAGNQASQLAAAQATQANPLASELPRVLLAQGLSLSEMGRQDEAIRIFRAVTQAYPRSSEAAEAFYRIGYIQEVHLEKYDEARIAYDQARQQGGTTFSDQARRRAEGLTRLVQLQAADTASAADRSVQTEAEKDFLAAELYYFQQEKTDKALEEYATVEKNYPSTSFAAKSALARAWILTFALNDTAAGRAEYERVLEQYPDTEQARLARQVLTGEAPEPPRPAISDSLVLPEPLVAGEPREGESPSADSLGAVVAPPGSPGAQPGGTHAEARTAPSPPGGSAGTPGDIKTPDIVQVVPAPPPNRPGAPPDSQAAPATTNPPVTATAGSQAAPARTTPPATTAGSQAAPARTTPPATTTPAETTPPVTTTAGSQAAPARTTPPATTAPADSQTAAAITPPQSKPSTGVQPGPVARLGGRSSRLAPPNASGLPRPISPRKFPPAPRPVHPVTPPPAAGAAPGAGAAPAATRPEERKKVEKPREKKSHGIPARGSIRPRKEEAPADTSGQGQQTPR